MAESWGIRARANSSAWELETAFCFISWDLLGSDGCHKCTKKATVKRKIVLRTSRVARPMRCTGDGCRFGALLIAWETQNARTERCSNNNNNPHGSRALVPTMHRSNNASGSMAGPSDIGPSVLRAVPRYLAQVCRTLRSLSGLLLPAKHTSSTAKDTLYGLTRQGIASLFLEVCFKAFDMKLGI